MDALSGYNNMPGGGTKMWGVHNFVKAVIKTETERKGRQMSGLTRAVLQASVAQ